MKPTENHVENCKQTIKKKKKKKNGINVLMQKTQVKCSFLEHNPSLQLRKKLDHSPKITKK